MTVTRSKISKKDEACTRRKSVAKAKAVAAKVVVKCNKVQKKVVKEPKVKSVWERSRKPAEDTEQTKQLCKIDEAYFSADFDVSQIFKLSKAFDNYKKLPQSFLDGIKIAENIVTSTAYTTAVSKLLHTLYPKVALSHDEIVNAIKEHFLIDSCKIGVDMDAYMCVRRCDERFIRSIYLNMSLFNQMLATPNDTPISQLYALFIAVKLAHECTHILHYIFSGDLRQSVDNLTPKLRYKPAARAHDIDDIGDALELELFGGLVRLIEGEGLVKGVKESMKLKHLVAYDYLSAPTGRVIKPDQSFTVPGSGNDSYLLSTAEAYNEPCKAIYHPMVHARKSAWACSADVPSSAMKAGAVRY